MDKDFYKKLGQWLSEKRKEKKLTQPEVARRMNTTKQCICNWEKGLRPMSAEKLVKYCEVCGIDLREFVECR